MKTIQIIIINNILDTLQKDIRHGILQLNINIDHDNINKITDTTFKVVLDWLQEYTEDIKLK